MLPRHMTDFELYTSRKRMASHQTSIGRIFTSFLQLREVLYFCLFSSAHWWFSGRILACHAGGPGSIPGQCTFWCKITVLASSSLCSVLIILLGSTFYICTSTRTLSNIRIFQMQRQSFHSAAKIPHTSVCILLWKEYIHSR